MSGLNKFRVLNILILLIFVFCIAAMYTNTKDITKEKANEAEISNEQTEVEETRDVDNMANNDEMNEKIRRLENRIDAMREDSSQNLSCRIQGIITSDGFEKLSESDAIQKASEEGYELAIGCDLRR